MEQKTRQSFPPVLLSMQLSFLHREKGKYLLTVSLFSERHILRLTKAYTHLSPRVQWQWCRKSELQRTPLFSKHSYWGEELIIQSQGPRQPHLIAPQKKGQSFSYEEPPGSAPCQLRGRVQYIILNGSLAYYSIKKGHGCLGEDVFSRHVTNISSNMVSLTEVWKVWRIWLATGETFVGCERDFDRSTGGYRRYFHHVRFWDV